jgi:DNA-binding SARP family transcriptional activator/Flp pilus assembly protein TadD
VRLRTFGALALSQDSAQCDEARIQKRQLTVLAILAAERSTGMSRERLLGLVWSGKEQDKARQLLNQAIHSARKALGELVVLDDSALLRLNGEVLSSDVDDFLAALESGDFEQAVAVYSGPYLDAVYVPDAAEFEHWVEEKRSLLARQFVEALLTLARRAQETANYERAAEYYRRAAASDPFSAAITHALMSSLASAGDVSAALNVGRVYASLVRQELEAEPDEIVQQLTRALRAGNVPSISNSNRAQPEKSAEIVPDQTGKVDGNTREEGRSKEFAAPTLGGHHSFRATFKWLAIGACLAIPISGESPLVRSENGPASPPPRAAHSGTTLAPHVVQSTFDGSDARVLYLRGQTLLARRTLASIRRAITMYRAAIRRDPRFAPAYASLALANALLPYFSNDASADMYAEARVDARRALSLDSGSAPAYVALGMIAIDERAWNSAELHLRHALSLNAEEPTAHFYLSSLFAIEDRATEALEQANFAFQLDPLSNPIAANLAAAYYSLGRNEEAELQARHTLELDSTYSGGHQELGFILLAEHRYSAAIHEFEDGIRLEGREPYAGDLGILGYAYGVSGELAHARAILVTLDSLARTTHVDPAAKGFVWLGMGDRDRAFSAFELSFDGGGALLMNYFPNDPIFNSIRVDPRFSVLLSRADLPASTATEHVMTISSTRCTRLDSNARKGNPAC